MRLPPRTASVNAVHSIGGARILAGVLAVVGVLGLSACTTHTVAPTYSTLVAPSPPASASPGPSATPSPTPTFDKTQFSIDDPASIWVVVDKLRPLRPADFVPPDLVTAHVRYSANATMRAEAAHAMEAMFAAAAAEGAGQMMLQNAYRSYDTQIGTYAANVRNLGQARADIASARPGYSEHQTGLAADIMSYPSVCGVQECFAQTPQGRWLAANAWRFGYLLRYPADKTSVTGYAFEPWHYRYIGVALATEMHDTGVTTLEEFFGLPPAPDYAR
jgi:D-alanyl-D-alanine carboxypeptidase